eukprot:scaffold2097_cov147-Pinguiococcus_pyrenoidosus.AAC.1
MAQAMVKAAGIAHFMFDDVLRPSRMIVKSVVQELAFVAHLVAAKDSMAARQEFVALHSEVLHSALTLELAHPCMVALDDLIVWKGHLRSDLLLFAVANAAWKEFVLVAMRDEADAAHKCLDGEVRSKLSHPAQGRGAVRTTAFTNARLSRL